MLKAQCAFGMADGSSCIMLFGWLSMPEILQGWVQARPPHAPNRASSCPTHPVSQLLKFIGRNVVNRRRGASSSKLKDE